jgi:hypothetical protein
LPDDSEDSNGSDHQHTTNGPGSSSLPPPVSFFQTPCVPYLPALGMFVNWYLIARMEVRAMVLLALYLGVTVSVYLWLCAPYSVGHLTRGWSGSTASGGSCESVVLLESEEEPETDKKLWYVFSGKKAQSKCLKAVRTRMPLIDSLKKRAQFAQSLLWKKR